MAAGTVTGGWDVHTHIVPPGVVAAIAEIVGTERILLGSDWPFPMGAPAAEHDLGHLDPALKRRIRKTNAEAAFGGRLRHDH